jgi:hypothetical protein
LRRAEEAEVVAVVVVAQPEAVGRVLLEQRAQERAPGRAVLQVGRRERRETALVAQREAA